jgi:glutamate-ammonia-ligase adenylyltransferase
VPSAGSEHADLVRARAIRDFVLRGAPLDDTTSALLRASGFADAPAAARALENLAQESSPYLAPSGRARTLLAGLAPRLLAALARAPDPDGALRNFDRATATLGAKATFYELLIEAKDVVELFVALAAASDFLVETLARRPGVFDEVVDRLLTDRRPSAEAITAEMEAALARAHDALRDVRAVHLLLVGIRDVSGKANAQNTGRDLATLAEAALGAILRRAEESIAERHGGVPDAGLVAIALGKLGGRELSYSSDLDLLFLLEGTAPAPDGTSAEAFYEEVAREALRIGEGPPSDEGPLYPIDLRLRPAGQRGRLVQPLDAALRYYEGKGPGERARDFERLALQKLRPVHGEAALRQRAASLLEAALYERDYGRELWDEVLSMRARQIELAPEDDLKRGRGGLADIEFLASALALAHGRSRPALREPNTVRLLHALGEAGLIDATELVDLLTAYQHLRRIELRLRVAANRPESKVPAGADRRELALRLGYLDGGARKAEDHFDSELRYHRARAQIVFGAVVARARDRAI